MDGLILLRRAQDAGLRVEAAGDKLLIRGPKRAEPVVKLLAENKAVVLAALTPTDIEAHHWQVRLTAKTFDWFGRKRPWQEARLLAWGDLQNDWHLQHGTHFPAAQCAGCGKRIDGHEALDMPDGNRVHRDPLDCAIAFGKRWRGAANAALAAFGLVPPVPERN
jgi:hypothetical protein